MKTINTSVLPRNHCMAIYAIDSRGHKYSSVAKRMERRGQRRALKTLLMQSLFDEVMEGIEAYRRQHAVVQSTSKSSTKRHKGVAQEPLFLATPVIAFIDGDDVEDHTVVQPAKVIVLHKRHRRLSQASEALPLAA